MAQQSIFTVEPQNLGALAPAEAVSVFRELLWAEASSRGIAKHLIEVPSAITVRDGGIDAEVRDVTAECDDGIIKQGLTRYQIKTGSFSVSKSSDLRSLLFRTGSDELHPRVKSCLDQHGTFVVILFGSDTPDNRDDALVDRIRTELARVDPAYAQAKVDLWRQNRLVGLINGYPSLALRVNRRPDAPFRTHRSWSEDENMRPQFRLGSAHEEILRDIRGRLRSRTHAIHIRLWGEPGIGKTRLALEALAPPDLSALTVYIDTALAFSNSPLMYHLVRDDNTYNVVLVLDECDPDARAHIWDKLKHRGHRVALISIYNEHDPTSGDILYYNVPLLPDECVSEIIKSYDVPPESTNRWIPLCGGSPRVAHVIGANLKYNPDDVLLNPATVNVWDRYVAGLDRASDPRVRERRTVLRHLALFKKFGIDEPHRDEAGEIWSLIEAADRSITRSRFLEIVDELRSRRILQGASTLYITPKLLHIKLWTEWWDVYGGGISVEEFLPRLPSKLREWFYEMFKYAAESPAASSVVSRLLGPEGPLRNEEILRTELGGRLFLALTEGDPEEGLRCLQATVGGWSKEELLRFAAGRREVVWALERIAIWQDLFPDAARLLLLLGEAENETVANNASGVFAGLFSLGPGRVAPTEASPADRLPVLREALESSSAERRRLGVRACHRALEVHQHSRLVGAEYQGLRREPRLWMPKTYGELFDAYRSIWQLLVDQLNAIPPDEQQERLTVVLETTPGLSSVGNLTDTVISTFVALAKEPFVDRKKLLATVLHILRYGANESPPEIRTRWEELRDNLTGTGFSAMLQRYVRMNTHDEEYDDQGKPLEAVANEIADLADQAVLDNSLLTGELEWLVTEDAANAYRFGYRLGTKDEDRALLSALLGAQRAAGADASVSFLGGYFRALRESDEEVWENALDAVADDPSLRMWTAQITGMSGMSERAAERILLAVHRGHINCVDLQRFAWSDDVRRLPEDTFLNWIDCLLEQADRDGPRTALALFYSYYVRSEEPIQAPKAQMLRILIHDAFFQREAESRINQMEEHDWEKVALSGLEAHSEIALVLAEKILSHFGEQGSIVSSVYRGTISVLDAIVKRVPSAVWTVASGLLGPPIDARAHEIKEWLHRGALARMPRQAIWDWVEEDVEERAWYLAYMVPKDLHLGEGGIAREVLIRYGERQDVRTNLLCNFASESWRGPESDHYKKRKAEIAQLKENEAEPNVRRWLEEYIEDLDRHIEQALIAEERQ